MTNRSDHVVICAVLLLSAIWMHAQDLHGVVNSYYRVIEIDTCQPSIIVDPKPTLARGDVVLLYQAKGMQVDTTNNAQFGVVLDNSGAGTYAYNSVYAVRGNEIILRSAVGMPFDPLIGVQCIRVATATAATVIDTVRALPWDGYVGGIVAIDCSDTLTVAAPISAAGAGFRGGRVSLNTLDTAEFRWAFPDDGPGGGKGESCADIPRWLQNGRAPNATGGGGGNARNGGGGGGGNTARGGGGGLQTSEFNAVDVSGHGGIGIVLPSYQARLLMGGGGGGGHQNDMQGTDGGTGGGIVIIRARTLVMRQGGKIDVSGTSAAMSMVDGAGGGGAGGTVLLHVEQAPQSIPVRAEGGAGGDARGTDRCYAPGGGGSGGLIAVTQSSALQLSSIQPAILGGRAGMYFGLAVACPDSSNYGATPGGYGGLTRIVDPPQPGPPLVPPMLVTRDTSICAGTHLALEVQNAQRIQWRPAGMVQSATSASTRTIALDSSVTLAVEMLSDRGCSVIDSIRVTVTPGPKATLTYASTILSSSRPSIRVATTTSYASYRWSSGQTTAAIDVDQPGTYWVSVTDQNGCVGRSDTVVIRNVNPSAIELLVQDATVRPGELTRVTMQLRQDDTLYFDISLVFDLQVRATMLVPADDRITGTTGDVRMRMLGTTLDKLTRTLTMRLQCDINDGEPRRRTISFPFTGALGDSVSSQIAIASCATSDTSVACVVEREGRARMDTLCVHDGRVRLFDGVEGVRAAFRDGALECEGAIEGIDVSCVDLLGRELHVVCAGTG
ncbi:MAG: hypothetical protein FGM24_06220, partial [Candidatus Kapabacteria bacterium]|nr:hypothetical protein [Candidatus Kapabacteria bacterium]